MSRAGSWGTRKDSWTPQCRSVHSRISSLCVCALVLFVYEPSVIVHDNR